MPINFDSALGIHADAVRVRSQRAELLATNMANVDTPNYKARDIDFQTAMKMSLDNQPAVGIKTTHAGHMGNNQANRLAPPALQYRMAVQDSLDGNTVDEQIEQAQFMQNSVQYQASVQFLGGKFKGLLTAIRGE